jgi:hypothetical protein
LKATFTFINIEPSCRKPETQSQRQPQTQSKWRIKDKDRGQDHQMSMEDREKLQAKLVAAAYPYLNQSDRAEIAGKWIDFPEDKADSMQVRVSGCYQRYVSLC